VGSAWESSGLKMRAASGIEISKVPKTR